MSHPFGELLKQYRRRKPGLSQERLAHRIGYDEAVLVRMSQGKKDLTGPSGRDRVVRLIEILHDEGTLHTLDEANALLAAAQLPPLFGGISVERVLIQILRPAAMSTSTAASQSPIIHYMLPAPVSSFIGREHDITSIAHMLQLARLVTLTGPGGGGKTRLALESGLNQAGDFTHGACFIGLAQIRHADDVVPAIAKALDVHESPGMPLLDSVKRFVASKSVLLLLDNFEHVLDSAIVVAELLTAASNVKVLATSREPLRLSGEHVYMVEPLELHSAIELFAQRARAMKPGFQVSDGTAPIVADICRRMDCLPLAVELAAARVRQFSPTLLLTVLNERRNLNVLNNAQRDAPTRHRTLRDAIAWSYNLLSKSEQGVLRVLGVFIGGAELEQIAHIAHIDTFRSERFAAGDSTDTINLSSNLQSLVDKNLVRAVEQHDGTTRYSLLELIREFVLEQLDTLGELNVTQRSHAKAFLHLAQEGMWPIRSHLQLYWLDRLNRDYPNFREALTWSFGDIGSELIGCQLVESLGYFWFIATRYLAEARAWLIKARNAKKSDMPPSVLGGVCASMIINGHLWTFADRIEVSREALIYSGATQDVRGIALARYGLGEGLLTNNPYDEEGLRVINECLLLCRDSGNEWMESHALHMIGVRARKMNDLVHAERLHRDMVEIRRRIGNVVEVSIGLWQLADVLTQMGRFDEANEYLQEAAMLATQVDSPQDVLHAQCLLGNNLRVLGDVNGAVSVLDACVVIARNRLPDRDLIHPLILLGKAENERRDPVQAQAYLSEAVRIIRSLNWPAWPHLAWPHAHIDYLDAFAVIAIVRGSAEASARLWGASDAQSLQQEDNLRGFVPYRALARESLSDAAYAAAYAEGRAMTLEQTIDYALGIESV